MWTADEIKVTEFSSPKCIVVLKENENNKLSTYFWEELQKIC